MIEEILWAVSAATLAAGFGMVYRRKTNATEAPNHPIRRTILDFVMRRPGTRLTAIWTELRINRGTVYHHLFILERIGAVQAVRGHRDTRYFPPNPDSTIATRMAVLTQRRVLEVAQAILREPGVPQHRLTKELHIDRRTFRKYADRLLEVHLVREERGGKERRYFPDDDLARFTREAAQLADRDHNAQASDRHPAGERP